MLSGKRDHSIDVSNNIYASLDYSANVFFYDHEFSHGFRQCFKLFYRFEK